MNSKGTAKRKRTDLPQRVEELYRSAGWRTRLHALFLRISMVVPLVTAVTRLLDTPPCRMALAQQSVSGRFYYPCKFALFRRSLADRFQGCRLVITPDPSMASL